MAIHAMACSDGQGDAQRKARESGSRFEAVYFDTLFADHCFRTDRAGDPIEVRRQQARLAQVRRQALARGMAETVRAAERRWTDFAARAEFVCENQPAVPLSDQIDELTRLLTPDSGS